MYAFFVRNQQGFFWAKPSMWLEEAGGAQVFRTLHYDVALNQLIEVNARDIEQRLSLWQCALDEKGTPVFSTMEPAKKQPACCLMSKRMKMAHPLLRLHQAISLKPTLKSAVMCNPRWAMLMTLDRPMRSSRERFICLAKNKFIH